MKTKILLICNKGRTRSKYLAEYLRKKGFATKFGGISKSAQVKITKNKLDWTDKIVIVDGKVRKKFLEEYGVPKKEIIMLNVLDHPRQYPREAQEMINKVRKKFKEKYVFPNLRRQIDKKLK